ncbi:hypothetical protein CDL15_Pgr004605 [Punica granatum]|uniref:Uncharacterized protein n=1 Tax=Punica granatum TaxID=22663 RepID=A0A218WQT8_PUNGR|nr:hypothetical protein CDL15_Pgr004605 [Punica granatum]
MIGVVWAAVVIGCGGFRVLRGLGGHWRRLKVADRQAGRRRERHKLKELGRELRENEGKLREKRERLVRTAAQGRECPRGAEGCGVV